MTNSVNITYEGFISMFPEFSDQSAYPRGTVDGFITQALCYISPNNVGVMTGTSRELAIYLLIAHLLTLNAYIMSGDVSPMLMQSANIDNVQISLTPPAAQTMRDQWYAYTLYGIRLKALLDSFIGMGFYMQGYHSWGI